MIPVPATSAVQLQSSLAERHSSESDQHPKVVLTDRGGHNGFHGPGDTLNNGCWSDRLCVPGSTMSELGTLEQNVQWSCLAIESSIRGILINSTTAGVATRHRAR